MTHAADTSATSGLPSQKRTTLRIAVLTFTAIGAIAGSLFVMKRDVPASCPGELIGAWKTAAAGYENGMLVITSQTVTFSVGGEHLEAQAVRRLETAPDGPRILYTLVYGPSRRDEQTLSLYYHTRDRTLRFKNQSHLVWTKASVAS
ncbi:MAG: hypothetical protein IT389_01180 [Nitrospira sp.]|nr:hypothetical protein [Nitrospira sp.]